MSRENLPAVREPDDLADAPPARARRAPRVPWILELTRTGGWLAAYLGIALIGVGCVRVLRERPRTLRGVLEVARHGRFVEDAGFEELGPPEGPLHLEALNLRRANALELAVERFLAHLRHFPDQFAPNLQVGETLLELRRYTEAARYLERAVVAAPADRRVRALTLLGMALLEAGHSEASEATLAEAEALAPGTGAVARERLRLLHRRKEWARIRNEAGEVDPEERDGEVQAWLARAWLEEARSGWRGLYRRFWDGEALARFRPHLGRAREFGAPRDLLMELEEEAQ